MTAIHLGFAVPTGTPVNIPLRNMAVCGQTQEAGKTTALEALITRAGVRAVTFVTKRGEASFTNARRIDPYFREQADWQFVASILEASRGEKLKFERAWIIRASKGARTLADVQRNVRKAMETAKGMSADVYLTLDAYLEAVVPTIAAVRWAPALELAAGVNAVDLTGLPMEMQHLVIKSSLDWVLEKEEHTVVVIPEAWKFVPEGRGTPVKRAALALIRQGSGLRNYVWLDSQDIGGVDKETLRSVPVWVLGVQRESNEIKRTLANIPAGVAKPKAADIALLELGQFFACWGKHAIKTYVQPAWMPEDLARQVAAGALDVGNASAIATGANVMKAARRAFAGYDELHSKTEDAVTKDEAARLTRENEQLKAQIADLQRQLEALAKGSHETKRGVPRADRGDQSGRGAAPAYETAAAGAPPGGHRADRGSAESNGHGQVDEALYQAIRARLLEDEPIILKALTAHPELVVEVTPRVVTVEGDTAKGRVARLMASGWFDTPRAVGAVRSELARTGKDPGGGGALGIMLNNFVAEGFFVRESGGFVLAPRVKVSERELRVS